LVILILPVYVGLVGACVLGVPRLNTQTHQSHQVLTFPRSLLSHINPQAAVTSEWLGKAARFCATH
jgi:hypothetical protein